VGRSETEAVGSWPLHKRAADAGAQNNLAVMHHLGPGAPKDDVAALELFRRAASQGKS